MITKLTFALALGCGLATNAASFGEQVSSADSDEFALDSRICASRTIGRHAWPVDIAYSGYNWDVANADNLEARIVVNDELELLNTNGEGVVRWSPPSTGSYVLKHICNGATSTSFLKVEGPSVDITRQKDTQDRNTFCCEMIPDMEGCTIYYTTDGSEPTVTSAVYVEPFAVDFTRGAVVRAMVVADGYPPTFAAQTFAPLAVEQVAATASDEFAFDGSVGTGDAPLVDSLVLPWDSSWVGGDANATVAIADNGIEVKRATGTGEFAFSGDAGLHELTYTTYVGGVAQDEVYATAAYMGWRYEVRNGGAVITETTRTSGTVTIPASIDGYPVTGLGDGLFAGCSNLTAVVISGNVRSIGEGAFADCAGLRRVEALINLKETIEANDVFADCPTDLEIVYVSAMITGVTAKQRFPWNGKVDVTYTLTGDAAAGLPTDAEIVFVLTATNRVAGTCHVAATNAISGDIGPAEGVHHVTWDLNAQGIEFKSDDVTFTVAYAVVPRYCVIDLSSGPNATNYPIAYLSAPPVGGFNADEYKTTKLVLRLIEPGAFLMCGSYQVTLTKPFYCGVFEVTQKQYELVTGDSPSAYTGDMRPVDQVSWDTIRGDSTIYNWPSSETVDSNSFMGRIQARTGLNFDLPTEAQWEYACRAGSTSDYSNGGDTEDNLSQLGRFWDNRLDGKGGYSQHTTVGSYLPNAWGLYDMHGNVNEWCLDWYGNLASGVIDPVGSSSGAYRAFRGYDWWCYMGDSNPPRGSRIPSEDYDAGGYYPNGFRLVRTLPNTNGERSLVATADALCVGNSASVVIDSRVDVEPVLDAVVLSWDASWIGGDTNATVVIFDNGTEVKRATGAGEFELSGIGRHELTYATYIGGVAQDEVYTATVHVQWKYEARDAGVVITGTSKTSGSVAIPSEIDGNPVIGIASGTFRDCTSLASVTIPDSVTRIGADAFRGCSNIVSVAMPSDMTIDLLHRWNFNGNLRDSIGGSDATIIGAVTTDGTKYNLPGGSSGSAYIDLGDNLVPDGVSAVTLEFWATQNERGRYDRIFDFGSMPVGYDFSRYNTSCYSSDNIRMYWGRPGYTDSDGGRWSLELGKEYHIAAVFADDGPSWKVTFLIEASDGSGYFFKQERNQGDGWSFDDVGKTEWLLGQPLTCWDYCACASYNEVRIWKCALSEGYFREGTRSGPDLVGKGEGLTTFFPDAYDGIRSVTIGGGTNALPTNFFCGANSLTNVDVAANVRSFGEVRLSGNGDETATNDGISTVTLRANGSGRLSFRWKASSEYDGETGAIYDYAYLSIDGEAQGTLDESTSTLVGYAIGGTTDWVDVTVDISDTGEHAFVWTYKKDAYQESGLPIEDCIWLDRVAWAPHVTATFDLGGGTGTPPVSVTELAGTQVNLPSDDDFAREDHVFAGWSDGVETYAAGAPYVLPGDDVTLTAQWIRKSALSFDLGGGDGEAPATIKGVPGAVVALPPTNGFAKAKHAFVGWYDGVQTYAAGSDYTVASTDMTFTAQWSAKMLARPTISSTQVEDGGTVDDEASVTLTLTADPGATIHYTLDGSVPTADSPVCVGGQLVLTELAVTVRALAVRDDYFDSEVSEFSFTRIPYTLAECLGLGAVTNVTVTAGGDTPDWHRVLGEEAHDGVAGLRSGSITHSQTNWVEMTVTGPGTLTFWWRASSEKTVRGEIRDGATFFADGTQVGGMIGGTNLVWAQVLHRVAGEGTHTFRWTYSKSATDIAATGEDCAWLDDVVWTPMADPIPPIGGDEDVAWALSGSADSRLAEYIKTADEYNAYRGWVDANHLDHQTVKDSSRAWLSYALDASNLVERAFQDGDLSIVSIKPSDGGAFALEVNVAGIEIGQHATAANLARVFSVGGSDCLDESTFSTGCMSVSFSVAANGNLSVVATPEIAYERFFFRVRMCVNATDEGWPEVAFLSYCVIDLSGGANAVRYPVVYMSQPPSGGFNADEYKTTKLVLRLIGPGSFMMCGQYEVTLTKPFYCGIFEVTQKQYELVTGANPSADRGNMRPVEQVSWNMIRGDSDICNWPISTSVDPNSFVGTLQARTGLDFDLPTEAQWEYACRAGTTSAYNNGGDTENDLKLLGRYWGDHSDGKGGYSAHTKVGSYQPNAWGLYDMHGNVWEWCLDWSGDLSDGMSDPVGASSGENRMGRGGGWGNEASICVSYNRGGHEPSYVRNTYGFRLARTLSNQ